MQLFSFLNDNISYMNILIEGPDCVGKSTQIQNIKAYYEQKGYSAHIIHYSNIKAFGKDFDAVKNASSKQFEDMFKLMAKADELDKVVLIFDRAHLGEVVYSPMYRNYDGHFVFAGEAKYCPKSAKLILFTDKAEEIIKRDIARGDGLSFSLDLTKKTEELALFDDAFNCSTMNKKRIALEGRDAETLWKEEVLPFIEENADNI